MKHQQYFLNWIYDTSTLLKVKMFKYIHIIPTFIIGSISQTKACYIQFCQQSIYKFLNLCLYFQRLSYKLKVSIVFIAHLQLHWQYYFFSLKYDSKQQKLYIFVIHTPIHWHRLNEHVFDSFECFLSYAYIINLL